MLRQNNFFAGFGNKLNLCRIKCRADLNQQNVLLCLCHYIHHHNRISLLFKTLNMQIIKRLAHRPATWPITRPFVQTLDNRMCPRKNSDFQTRHVSRVPRSTFQCRKKHRLKRKSIIDKS